MDWDILEREEGREEAREREAALTAAQFNTLHLGCVTDAATSLRMAPRAPGPASPTSVPLCSCPSFLPFLIVPCEGIRGPVIPS